MICGGQKQEKKGVEEMRRDFRRYQSEYSRCLENKDKPEWERMQIEREWQREKLREMDEERRAYEQKKKAEREEKKRKAKEEKELIEQLEKEAAKAIEKAFADLFK